MNDNRFYVYGHYTADTNELFYIGKGTGYRAWDAWSRNIHWWHVTNTRGKVVKLLYENLTEEEAYTKEKELITQIGLRKLTNFCIGGRAFTSEDAKRLRENPQYRKNLREAIIRASQDPVLRKRRSDRMKERLKDPEYKAKWAADHNTKTYDGFIDPNGKVYRHVYNLTEFCQQHNIDRTNMLRVYYEEYGYKSCKGWTKYYPPDELHKKFFTF